MAGVNCDNREGHRKRPLSESDSDKISELTLAPKSPINQTLNTNSDHVFDSYHSNPNLNSPEDIYIETPLGMGRCTRLQSRRGGEFNSKHDKALKDCLNLIKEIESWLIDSYEDNILDVDIVNEAGEKFKRRIARVSQEALIRLVDRSIVDQLACLQIRLEQMRKRVKREERRQDKINSGRDNQTESPSHDRDSNVIFTTDLNPPSGITSLPIPSFEELPPPPLSFLNIL